MFANHINTYKKFDDFFPLLSKRHIDVLACLSSHQNTKQIATILGISPRTVEKHIFDLTQKFELASRTHLVENMQHSRYTAQLFIHYQNLSSASEFSKFLKKIRQKVSLRHVGCKLVCTDGILKYRLKQDLNSLGITIYERKHDIATVHILNTDDKLDKQINYVVNQSNYFLLFFEVLTKVIDTPLVWEALHYFQNTSVPQQSKLSTPNFSEDADKRKKEIFSKKQQTLLITLFIFFLLSGGIIIYKTYLFSETVRSDLLLPHKSQLLDRPKIIDKIHSKFNNKKIIQIVSIIGVGGAGKTTIARQYAHSQKVAIIWEVHAETETSLIRSFEQLADALSTTKLEREEFENIQKTEKVKERIKKILRFVKTHLKKKTWFLIFDNVENFHDILPFFPCDAETWGSGKVLVTTRNDSIKDSQYVNPENAIYMDDLDAQEKLSLFTKMVYGAQKINLSSKNKKNLIAFLSALPPFPLDISLAGSYMKKYNKTTYQEYLNFIHSTETIREKTQVDLLKRMSDYLKTRYGIVSYTLKSLTEQYPDFKKLLTLVSIVGADAIPKDLLDRCVTKNMGEMFVCHMEQRCLIKQFHTNQRTFLGIHRSTQEAIIEYINKNVPLEEKSRNIEIIVEKLDQYADMLMDRIDLPELRTFLGHLLICLKHSDMLNLQSRGVIETQIGRIYYYLGDFLNAKPYLESGLALLNQSNENKTRFHFARAQSYLGIVFRQLGDYMRAKKLLEDSIKLYQKIPEHRQRGTAWAFLQLGNVYTYIGDYEKAEEILKISIEFYKKQYGANHPNIAWASVYLGDKYRFTGDDIRGAKCYETGFNIYKKIYGDTHPKTAWSAIRLANGYKRLGYYTKAEELYKMGCSIYTEKFPESLDSISWSAVQLGDMYRVLGLYEKAVPLLKQAVTIAAQCHGVTHVQTAWWSGYLAKLYIDTGNYQKAQKILLQNLMVYEKCFQKNPVKIAWIMRFLANTYKYYGDVNQAEQLFEKSLKIYEQHYGPNSKEVAHILRDFGHFYILKGNYLKAESLIYKALDIFTYNKNIEMYRCFECLGELYSAKSRSLSGVSNFKESEQLKNKAINYLKEALIIAIANFPKKSAHISRIGKKIKDLSGVKLKM